MGVCVFGKYYKVCMGVFVSIYVCVCVCVCKQLRSCEGSPSARGAWVSEPNRVPMQKR